MVSTTSLRSDVFVYLTLGPIINQPLIVYCDHHLTIQNSSQVCLAIMVTGCTGMTPSSQCVSTRAFCALAWNALQLNFSSTLAHSCGLPMDLARSVIAASTLIIDLKHPLP